MDPFRYLCFVSFMLSYLFIAGWERANLLALLYVMFSCVFVTLPCGVLGQVWFLVVSIPIFAFLLLLFCLFILLLPYFDCTSKIRVEKGF